ATALYGSRAASGVVVITTKKGEKSKGIGVSINSSATFENPLRLPQYQNQYGQGLGSQFQYENGEDGAINDGSIYSYGPALNGQLITQFTGASRDVNGNVVRGGDVIARAGNAIEATPFVANPDNVKNFYETGQTYINNVALSGANDLGDFRLSFTNLDNQGMVPNTDLQRNSLSLSGGLNLTDKLKVRTFLNYINSNSNNRPATGYGSENVQYLFTWMGRQADVESLKNYWQAGQEGLQQFNYNYLWMDNPYFAMFENTNGFNKDRLIGNVAVSYDFTENLSLTLRSGMDNYNDLRASQRAFSTQRFRNGAYREDAVNYREINTDFLLNYKNNLGKNLDYSFGIGGNRLDQTYSYTSTTAGELSVPGIYNFENSRTPLDVSQENFQKRINSLYGLGQIAYKSSLFLDVTLRNDWSSTLPADNNSYAYYSASLSSVFSEFMQLPSYVSFLKGRVSVASVGNDTDPYNLKNTFVFGQPYGANPTVSASNNLLNSQFRPERVNSYEVGADVRLWNNRIGLDVALYRNISQDQIVELPVSTSSGYTSRIVNGGKIRNQGIEAILNIQPIQRGAFNWNSYFNFSRNIARVESLPADIDQYVTGFSRVYGRSDRSVFYIAQEGGRMGDMYGTGLLQVDGRNVYDENGNPVKDPNLRLLGNYNPDFILGWGNDFSYKNINFGFLFDLRYGGTIVSRTLAIASTSGALENTLVGRETGVIGDGVVNVGTPSEPQYEENATAIAAQPYYIQFFDRDNEANALYDATYLKLREAYIGISLPKNLIERIGFADATFSVVGRNLLLFTENPHFDPELNALQGRSFAQGVEDMSYPSARSVGVSLRLKI
ncbi:MAG: SusC/RagA family TonB-linked outer membrane protein, partial [Saprospiraceae bacterium]